MSRVDVYSANWLIPRYGVMAHDYADVYPEMVDALRTLYLERAAKIPWLPADWRASVNHLHGRDGKLLIPVPVAARANDGTTNKFAITPEQQAWWDQFAADARAIQVAYAAKDAAKGRLLMQRAYDNAAFWDKAYRMATVIAVPVTAVQAIGKTAWNNPGLTGVVVWGGLGLLAFLLLRHNFTHKG